MLASLKPADVSTTLVAEDWDREPARNRSDLSAFWVSQLDWIPTVDHAANQSERTRF
jgi:hypothetical protein